MNCMSEESKKVFSIIMPVFNREKVVLNAVNSILSQSFKDFELIIVDDASSDDSVQTIQAICDERISVIALAQNKGAAYARNIGIQKSTGDYITFLDSDDTFDNEYLEETYKKLSNTSSDLGFVWCGTRFHELAAAGETKVTERIWNPKIISSPYHTFLKSLHIGIGCGVTFKKEVFKKIGYFNEQLPAAEDTDFFLRVSQQYNFAVIEKVLVNIYKTGSDRMSTRFNKLSKAYQLFIPSHLNAIESDKELRLKYYYKLCWLSYYDNKKTSARKYFRKVLKDAPFHTKAWTVGLLFELFGEKKAAKIHQKLSRVM
jgi:glycosyltransferase involved in cell wall biosynthesis